MYGKCTLCFYRRERRPVELFESLKMKSRLKFGLPMIAPVDESIAIQSEKDAELQRGLEEGLLDACRQAGAMLIENGRIGEGWMYLRPIGDPSLAKRLLAKVEINEDNYDEMIHVLVHEGVDLQRGYKAVIDQQGTCNSITMYDSSIASRSRQDRKIAAACLLDHLYEELDARVRCPVLALWGEFGKMHTLFDVLATWREKADHVEGHALPCGHFIAEESPDVLLASLREFLRA